MADGPFSTLDEFNRQVSAHQIAALAEQYPEAVAEIWRGRPSKKNVKRLEEFAKAHDHGDLIVGLLALKFAPARSFWQLYGRYAVTLRLKKDFENDDPLALSYARFALDFTKDMPDKHLIVQTCLLEIQKGGLHPHKPRSDHSHGLT